MHIWQYTLPSIRGSGWAIVILRSDGYFSTVSDYGNYAYMWTHTGCEDFREFLIEASKDWGYIAKKLNPRRVLDSEASCRDLTQALLKARRQNQISKDQAAVVFDALLECEGDWATVIRHPYITNLYPSVCDEFTVTRLEGDVESYCKVILPRLTAILEKELKS